MTEENQIKKDYLLSYLTAVKSAEMIEDEIKELRYDKMHPKVSLDGMPKGNEKGDLSSYAAQLDAITQKLIHARYKKITVYSEIIASIEQMANEKEQLVLRYRYIHDMKWEKVCAEMRYERTQINRIHGSALEHFKIMKKELGKESNE